MWNLPDRGLVFVAQEPDASGLSSRMTCCWQTCCRWWIPPLTRGDPQSPLRWTCKSLRTLAEQLRAIGHSVSHVVVGQRLKAQGYRLQATALTAHLPVISVDTKKKELVGAYKNAGREWLPSGQPESVKVHDFVDPEWGRANPYGVYDIGHDEAWVSVGTDHDTAAFAVQTIRRWWFSMGRQRYPDAKRLVITADGGAATATGFVCGNWN